MTVSKLRDRVASSLVQTTEQIKKGGSKHEVRIVDMYLGDIQRHFGRSAPDEIPKFASRVYVAEQDPGGETVTVDKNREGLFAITTSGCILAHDLSWGRTLTRAFSNGDLKVEPVTMVIKDGAVPAFRLAGPATVVVGLRPVIGGNVAMSRSVRDDIVEIIRAADGSQSA